MIGIIGALREEIEIIKNNMTQIEVEEFLGGKFYRGAIFEKDVVLSECSIGKVNAAVVTTVMIIKYNPDLIINSGISGSLSDKVKILDVVVGDTISIHDEGEVFKKFYPFSTIFNVNQRYIDIVKDSYKEINKDLAKLHVGGVLTGDEFIDKNEKKQELRLKFPKSLTVDMECGAISKVCLRAKKDIITIKTISDEADDNADNSYDNFINLAAEKSSKIVLELIKRI